MRGIRGTGRSAMGRFRAERFLLRQRVRVFRRRVRRKLWGTRLTCAMCGERVGISTSGFCSELCEAEYYGAA